MNFRNKRGIELMGRTLVEIMVATMVVILLLYAGYALFQMYFGNKSENQAAGQMEEIIEKTNSLELGMEEEMPVLVPMGWHLVSFHKNVLFVDDFEKPFLMQDKDCLCICKDKKCSICKSTDKPFKMSGESFAIKIPVDITIIKYEEYYDFSIK